MRVGDLIDGRINHSRLKRISAAVEAPFKRSRLRGDELLVSCVGSVGVVVLVTENETGFNIARAVARVRVSASVSREFLAAYLSTPFAQHYFTRELRTVSQPTLNIKQLAETPVMLPGLSLQKEFAGRVSAVDKLKTAHRSSLSEMDALFASLQHCAFRGEL